MGRTPVGRAFFLSLFSLFGLIAAPPGTAQTPAPLPLHDGFEFGAFAPWWTADSNANSRTRVLGTLGPVCGVGHAVLDSAASPQYALNELVLHLDLQGYEQVSLSFLARTFGGQPHLLAPWAAFTGSPSWDGLAASPDGVTWYPLRPLTTDHGLTAAYTEFTVDLDAAATVWGFSYTNTFLLRFSHYDNAPADGSPPNAGLGLDEVRVTGRVRGDYDFGDAPAPYPSVLADDGARHARSAGPFLGAVCDYEGDALSSWNALGDDGEHTADEDGVVLAGALVPGDSTMVNVTVTAFCFLDVWVDFGQNGSWSDPGDQVFAVQPLNAGTNALSIAVPAGAVLGANAFARFRVSSAPVGMPTGAAADGEAEDYRFEIVPPAPVMSSEPTDTPGTENIVFWSAMAGADTYRAMMSPDPAFLLSPMTADWGPLTEHTFTGLDEGLFYYRAQAGAFAAGHEETWGQSTAATFEQGTLAGTELDAAGAVTLAHASGGSFTVGGGVPFLRTSFTGAVRGNVFKAEAGAVLTRVEFLLGRAAPTAAQIVVYEGGMNVTDPYTLVLTRDLGTLPVGLDYADSGPFNLPLTANRHYFVAAAAEGTVVTNRNPVVPASQSGFGSWVKVYYADTYPAPAAIPGTNLGTSVNGYCQRLTFHNSNTYASPGTCVSPVVAPGTLSSWKTLEYNATVPASASLTVDVLPASGTTPFPGFSGLVSGASLAGLPLEPVRLRASFATSNNTQTAALHSWGLRWRAEADRVVAGPWSGAVSSRQDQLPPSVAEVTLLDASPTRSASVSFGVRFTEPVEKVELGAPFDDFAVSAGAPAGAAVTGVSGADDLYTVTVSTGGGVSGTVGLRVLASGGLHDALGREMAADYDAGPVYEMDFTPPTVAEIMPLDGSPTNAPLVRWRVRFSEPMTDAPTASPFAGFTVEGVTGAAVIAVVAEPDACVVTAATGPHDGDLLLRVLAAASPLRDRVGWPLDGDALSPGAYAVRHLDWAIQPPATVQAREGQPFTLHAQATGGIGGTAHQWFFSPGGAKTFEEVSGATTAAWTVPHALTSQAGDYYCEASDAWETIQSTTTSLEVEDSLPLVSSVGLALCAAALAMAGARRARLRKAARR